MVVNNLTIRLLTTTDLNAVLTIERDCYSQPWTAQQFIQELDNPAAEVLIGEQKGRLVGYLCFWLIAGEMQILNIAILPNQQRRGIAAQLLEHAFNRCAAVELSSAWLEVRSGNLAAIALYQRSGFKLNTIRRGYYRDGEDALIMVKTFSG